MNIEIQEAKKKLNETKTEAELHTQYLERQIEGTQSCTDRKYKKEITYLEERIAKLKSSISKEELVHETTTKRLQEKTELLRQRISDHEKAREDKMNKFDEEKKQIHENKKLDEEEVIKMTDLIAEEDKLAKKRDQEEQAEAEDQARIQREKMACDDAARQIQRKWDWFQREGKFLAKKKKGKKGKKKKK